MTRHNGASRDGHRWNRRRIWRFSRAQRCGVIPHERHRTIPEKSSASAAFTVSSWRCCLVYVVLCAAPSDPGEEPDVHFSSGLETRFNSSSNREIKVPHALCHPRSRFFRGAGASPRVSPLQAARSLPDSPRRKASFAVRAAALARSGRR